MTVTESARKVLIVDDEPIALEVARGWLRSSRGMRSDRNVRADCPREQADLVLLDVNMPALAGDALTKMIEQMRSCRSFRRFCISLRTRACSAPRRPNAAPRDPFPRERQAGLFIVPLRPRSD
jgi:CheY-like chemotaxis protein